MIPSVLPKSSVPSRLFLSHLCCFMERTALPWLRTTPSMSPKVCSATEIDVAAGVLATAIAFLLGRSAVDIVEADAGPDEELEVFARPR